jgi:hypothetical protein
MTCNCLILNGVGGRRLAERPMSMARRDVDTLELDFSLFTISIPSVDFACSDF